MLRYWSGILNDAVAVLGSQIKAARCYKTERERKASTQRKRERERALSTCAQHPDEQVTVLGNLLGYSARQNYPKHCSTAGIDSGISWSATLCLVLLDLSHNSSFLDHFRASFCFRFTGTSILRSLLWLSVCLHSSVLLFVCIDGEGVSWQRREGRQGVGRVSFWRGSLKTKAFHYAS